MVQMTSRKGFFKALPLLLFVDLFDFLKETRTKASTKADSRKNGPRAGLTDWGTAAVAGPLGRHFAVAPPLAG